MKLRSVTIKSEDSNTCVIIIRPDGQHCKVKILWWSFDTSQLVTRLAEAGIKTQGRSYWILRSPFPGYDARVTFTLRQSVDRAVTFLTSTLDGIALDGSSFDPPVYMFATGKIGVSFSVGEWDLASYLLYVSENPLQMQPDEWQDFAKCVADLPVAPEFDAIEDHGLRIIVPRSQLAAAMHNIAACHPYL